MRQAIKVRTPACTGCRLCELVCSLYHEGAVNPEKARLWVSETPQESLYEPHICQLCVDPPCVAACPLGALSQGGESGLIGVDMALCNGCSACVEACPYQAVRWSDAWERLYVCDRCGGEPTCVQFCYREVLKLA